MHESGSASAPQGQEQEQGQEQDQDLLRLLPEEELVALIENAIASAGDPGAPAIANPNTSPSGDRSPQAVGQLAREREEDLFASFMDVAAFGSNGFELEMDLLVDHFDQDQGNGQGKSLDDDDAESTLDREQGQGQYLDTGARSTTDHGQAQAQGEGSNLNSFMRMPSPEAGDLHPNLHTKSYQEAGSSASGAQEPLVSPDQDQDQDQVAQAATSLEAVVPAPTTPKPKAKRGRKRKADKMAAAAAAAVEGGDGVESPVKRVRGMQTRARARSGEER